MNTNFIKVGTTITPVPEGIDYTLSLDKAYKLFWNDWENQVLELFNDLNIAWK